MMLDHLEVEVADADFRGYLFFEQFVRKIIIILVFFQPRFKSQASVPSKEIEFYDWRSRTFFSVSTRRESSDQAQFCWILGTRAFGTRFPSLERKEQQQQVWQVVQGHRWREKRSHRKENTQSDAFSGWRSIEPTVGLCRSRVALPRDASAQRN